MVLMQVFVFVNLSFKFSWPKYVANLNIIF